MNTDPTMITTNFHAPYLHEEFKGENLFIELNKSLDITCVCRIVNEATTIPLFQVSHFFRLLQIPVQKFLIWQLLYFNQSQHKDLQAWLDVDAAAAQKVVGKHGVEFNSSIIYAMSVFIPSVEYSKDLIKNISLLYKNNVEEEKSNYINRFQTNRNETDKAIK